MDLATINVNELHGNSLWGRLPTNCYPEFCCIILQMKDISIKILAERKKKVAEVTKILKKLDPHPRIALDWKTPWQLIVAVQLSAQCTDKKVNEVTPALFKKYKKLEDYINANPAEFDHDIRQITFHRNKTKNIIGAAKKLKK